MAHDKGNLAEYTEFLVATFEKVNNLSTQRRILGLFGKYVTKKTFDEVFQCLMRCLDSFKSPDFKQEIIGMLISKAREEHYDNIDDFGDFLMVGIPTMCKYCNSLSCATSLAGLIEVKNRPF